MYQRINDNIAEGFKDLKEVYLKHFQWTYSNPLPPSNMALETLTFGSLSKLYKGLNGKYEEKMLIANQFKLAPTILAEWLVYMNNVRNICAHHSRLWNKIISVDRPTVPTRKKYKFSGSVPEDFNRTVYGVISMMERFLQNINPHNKLIFKITELLNQYPLIDPKDMGFPEDWKDNPAWKIEEH